MKKLAILLTLTLINSTSYATPSQEEDLKRRQQIVNLQLEKHQLLNGINSTPNSNFSGAIQQFQKEQLSQNGPSFALSVWTDVFYDINNEANDAKHNWK